MYFNAISVAGTGQIGRGFLIRPGKKKTCPLQKRGGIVCWCSFWVFWDILGV